MKFVSRERQHVNILFLDINFYMSRSLNRVSVKYNAVFTAYLSDFRNGLYGAYLVVCKHYCHKASAVRYCLGNVVGVYDTVFSDIKQRDFKSLFFKLFKGMQYRVMLKRRRYDVFLSFFFTDGGGRDYRLIVRLTAAGGEYDFRRFAAESIGHISPCLSQRVSGRLPGRMKT